MVTRLFSVYDKKSQIYHPPFHCHNEGHAKRMFTSFFKKQGTVFAEYPKDFQVWEIGKFDDSKGMISGSKNNTIVCEAIELVEEEKGE